MFDAQICGAFPLIEKPFSTQISHKLLKFVLFFLFYVIIIICFYFFWGVRDYNFFFFLVDYWFYMRRSSYKSKKNSEQIVDIRVQLFAIISIIVNHFQMLFTLLTNNCFNL